MLWVRDRPRLMVPKDKGTSTDAQEEEVFMSGPQNLKSTFAMTSRYNHSEASSILVVGGGTAQYNTT